jgi:hypothetical protein
LVVLTAARPRPPLTLEPLVASTAVVPRM